MKPNRSESVRHLQSMKDTMLRYQGEIKRLVDAAETVCHENRENEFRCPLTNRKAREDYYAYCENKAERGK